VFKKSSYFDAAKIGLIGRPANVKSTEGGKFPIKHILIQLQVFKGISGKSKKLFKIGK
jgi:hypothetical protein